jgi:tRNA pseudouridine55 synthase
LATGVLPVCLGEATKLSGYLLDSDKRYAVRAAVGYCTATGDAEGEPTRHSDAPALTRDALLALLPRFTGEILQRPPMYSALKHAGKRLYELAREGQEVEREPRPITIHELTLTAFGPGSFELDVRCSKGTYIRTLVEELAASAGQCAHVAALRRTAAGPFREGQMLTLEALEALAGEGLEALDARLLPMLDGLAGWSRVAVDPEAARRLALGQSVLVSARPAPGMVAVTDERPALLGIAEMRPSGELAPKRWLR